MRAVLGLTGGWGIRWLCTPALFLPPCQPVRLPPPAQPGPLCLLTQLLTWKDTARSESSSLCPVPPEDTSFTPFPFTERTLKLGSLLPIVTWWQRWDFHLGTQSPNCRTSVFLPDLVPKLLVVTSPQALGSRGPGLLPEGQQVLCGPQLGYHPGLRSPCMCDCAHGCV